jgi:general secretion pathway protein N
VPLRHAPLARARAPTEDPVDHTDAWVRDILARPLFSRDRRPTPPLARSGGDTVLTSLPRLTGVLVGAFGRNAIFAGESGGKPLVIEEGGHLGPYTVKAIEPGRVTVAGPEGERQLEPSFDANARRAVAETPPQPQLPQRPQVLNVRPGSQFQRALSVIEGARNAQQGTE